MTFTSSGFKFCLLSARHETPFKALYTDDSVMRSIGKPFSPDKANEYFTNSVNNNQSLQPKALIWAIESHLTEFIGLVGFSDIQANPGRAEMGIILRADKFGRGAGAESILRVMQFGFEQLSLNSIYVNFRADNLPVQKMALNFGFSVRSVATCDRIIEHKQGVLTKTNWQRRLRANCAIIPKS